MVTKALIAMPSSAPPTEGHQPVHGAQQLSLFHAHHDERHAFPAGDSVQVLRTVVWV